MPMEYAVVETRLSKDFGFSRFAFEIAPQTATCLTPVPLQNILALMRLLECTHMTVERIGTEELNEEIAVFESIMRNTGRLITSVSVQTRRLTFFRAKESIKLCEEGRQRIEQFESNILPQASCLGTLNLCTYYDGSNPIKHYIREAVISSVFLPKTDYIHVKTCFLVEMGQHTFKLDNGTYFAQQDGHLGCCAHAAIIMTLQHIFARKTGGHIASISPLEINKLINEIDYVTRMPHEGLNIDEIKDVLNQLLGKFHLKYTAFDWEDVQKESNLPEAEANDAVIASGYYSIETGLPAILGFSADVAHAMCVIGHTFDPLHWVAQAYHAYFKTEKKRYLPSHTWVGGLKVQDDNLGPYRTLPRPILWPHQAKIVVSTFPGCDFYPEQVEKLIENWLWPAPAYNQRAEADISEAYITDLAASSVGKSAMKQSEWLRRLIKHIRDGSYTMRVLFITAKSYIDFLNENSLASQDLPAVIDETLFAKVASALDKHSRYWIVELGIPFIHEYNNRRLGEIVAREGVELTTGKPTPSVIVARFPAVVSIQSEENEQLIHYSSGGDFHYPIINESRLMDSEISKLLEP